MTWSHQAWDNGFIVSSMEGFSLSSCSTGSQFRQFRFRLQLG